MKHELFPNLPATDGANASAKKNRLKREVAERRAQSGTRRKAAPQTFVLVSCVSRKAGSATAAKDLYLSDWFVKAREYAEKNGDAWFILSALHGLIEPGEIIEPYNVTLKSLRKNDRTAWAQRVGAQMLDKVSRNSRVVVLAGRAYRDELMPILERHFTVEIPMRGLGIGQQLAFLKRKNESGLNS